MLIGQKAQEGNPGENSAEVNLHAARSQDMSTIEIMQKGLSDSGIPNSTTEHPTGRPTLSQCLKNKWSAPIYNQQAIPSHILHDDPMVQDKPLDASGLADDQPQVERNSGDKRKADEELDAPAKKVYQQIGLGAFIHNAPAKEFVCPQKVSTEVFEKR